MFVSASATSARSATETSDDTSDSATPSRTGVALIVKMRCVGRALVPLVRGSVRFTLTPGFIANSSKSTVASAYVLPDPDLSSSSSRSWNSAGLGSYVPDLGLTNMVHASESSSSHCASPRCDLADCGWTGEMDSW